MLSTWKQEGAIRWTYLEEAAAEREGEKGNRKEATGMGLVELYRLMACNDIYSCSICTCHITIWHLKPHTNGMLAAYEPLCLSPCAARLPTSFQDTFSIVTWLRETEAIDKVKKLILFFQLCHGLWSDDPSENPSELGLTRHRSEKRGLICQEKNTISNILYFNHDKTSNQQAYFFSK